MPKRGQDHHMAKLTEAKVKEIRQLLLQGQSDQEVADLYGVHVSTIYKIGRREIWARI